MNKIRTGIICLILTWSFYTQAQNWKLYADSARTYQEQRNPDKAIEYYNMSQEQLRKDSSGSETYAKLGNSLSQLYRQKGQLEKALAIALESRKIRENLWGKEHALYGTSCNTLGLVYKDMNQFAKAEALYLEAKLIYEKKTGRFSSENASVCLNLGVVYRNTGKFEDAERYYLEAKEIREKLQGKESLEFATACNNLAVLYKETGRLHEAEYLYLESKRIRESKSGKLNTDYPASCNNLANLYIAMGKYDAAELMLLEALEIWEKVLGRNHQQYGIACMNMGNLYSEMGVFDKAGSYFIAAKNIIEKNLGKEHPVYASICANLGNSSIEAGAYDKAEQYLLEAKAIYEKKPGKNNPDYGRICLNLVRLYMDRQAFDKVMPYMLEAKQLFLANLGEDHPLYGSSCKSMGLYYYTTGKYDEAEPLMLKASQINEKSLGEEHPDCIYDYNDLASLYWLKGEKEKAFLYFKKMFAVYQLNLKRVFQFTSETEKTAFSDMFRVQYNNFMSFVKANPSFVNNDFVYDILIASRNLISAHSSQLKESIFSKRDTIVINKYQEWVNLREQIAFWLVKPVGERNNRDSLLNVKASILEKDLTRLSADFNRVVNKQNASKEDVIKNLQPAEAIVEFAEFNYYKNGVLTDSTYYLALVLRKDKPAPALTLLFEQRQLEAVFGYNKKTAGQVQVNNLYNIKNTKNNQALYDLVWEPLENELTGISTVYFAPAGSLFKISFAAIPLSESRLLSDKFKLVQVNTTASVNGKTDPGINTADKIVLYGGIKYDVDSTSMRLASLQSSGGNLAVRGAGYADDKVPEFGYLSGTEKEINGISKQAEGINYQPDLLKGMNATEESFKRLSGERSPAVLHVATHGFFFPDPGNSKTNDHRGGVILFRSAENPLIRSGLALAGANNAWKGKPVSGVEDGILTAYEVSNMYLPNTKLAVLSACETGLGDVQGNEGVYGLQRAFKIAGVQNLVMSLWKVPDAETAEFMQQFYKGLFAKQSIEDAFYNTQNVMKNKYRNDPYKWAAWVLVR